MQTALAPYVELPLAPVTPVALADAIREIPILRDIAPPACVADSTGFSWVPILRWRYP